MTSPQQAAHAKWYNQTPTPFETEVPEHSLKITKAEDGQVAEINVVAKPASPRSSSDREEGDPSSARKYQLIKSFDRADPAVEAPFLLIAEMEPPQDEDDFNAWYNQEHVPMVSEMPGYVRCRRYEILPAGSPGRSACKYLTIHEVQDLNGFMSPPALASGETGWTIKQMSQVKGFKMTGWKLVES